MKQGPLLYALAFEVANTIGAQGQASNWETCASFIAERISNWPANYLPMHERYPRVGFGTSLILLLDFIGQAANRDGASSLFAAWIEDDLVPVLQDALFTNDRVILPVLLKVYLKYADEAGRVAALEHLEKDNDSLREHKSVNYLEIAERAAEFHDIPRADRLLKKGVRSAITYDYHKETTVWSFIEGIALLGKNLGSDLRRYVVQAASLLEMLESITDHDELRNIATELITAVAISQPDLAARLARQLQRRLDRHFFRSNIADSLSDRGIPCNDVIDAFKKEEVDIYRDPWEHSPGPPDPSRAVESQGIDSLIKEYIHLKSASAQETSRSRNYQLEYAIIGRISDPESLGKAIDVLKGISWNYKVQLAKKCFLFSRAGTGTTLLEEAANEALEKSHWFWSYEKTQLFKALAEHLPEVAYTTLSEGADYAAINDPDLMGHVFVESIMRVLIGKGDTKGAIVTFDALARHLEELMQPYPDLRSEWEDLLTPQDE